MSTIEIRDLEMRFGEFKALQDVALDVKQGEFVTLLGPSGGGKTTLLKVISGFLAPTRGVIRIGGTDVTHTPPEKRDTALCFQSYALFPHLTIKDNLEFGLKEKRLPADERRKRLADVAEQLELGPQLAKLPNQLSGGQQQRVALGRALVMRPSVILFDEPLSNLDARLRDSVRIEIRRIQQDNKLTAVYVTHDQSEALAMSDRVVVLRDGKIEQIAPPEELYHAPKTSFVADFIGGANIMDAEVIEQEDDNSWRLQTALGEFIVESDRTPTSKTIRISWRPESAVIGGKSKNSFRAKVTDRSFQGAHTDLFAINGKTRFKLSTEDSHIYAGEQISVSLEADKIVLLESAQ